MSQNLPAAQSAAFLANIFPSLDDLAARHHAWVESMGWHNKSRLESMGLVGSEIAEAIDECYGETCSGTISDNFAEELADICLRCMDLAHTEGVALDTRIETTPVVWRSGTLVGRLGEVMVEFGRCMNTVRGAEAGEDFAVALTTLLRRVLEIARWRRIELRSQIERKMAANLLRGTRGRLR